MTNDPHIPAIRAALRLAATFPKEPIGVWCHDSGPGLIPQHYLGEFDGHGRHNSGQLIGFATMESGRAVFYRTTREEG